MPLNSYYIQSLKLVFSPPCTKRQVLPSLEDENNCIRKLGSSGNIYCVAKNSLLFLFVVQISIRKKLTSHEKDLSSNHLFGPIPCSSTGFGKKLYFPIVAHRWNAGRVNFSVQLLEFSQECGVLWLLNYPARRNFKQILKKNSVDMTNMLSSNRTCALTLSVSPPHQSDCV